MNAYTSFDRTVYFLTISSQYAEKSVDLLSDAVFHSLLTKRNYLKKEVIVEELIDLLIIPPIVLVDMFSRLSRRNKCQIRSLVVKKVSLAQGSDLVNFHKGGTSLPT